MMSEDEIAAASLAERIAYARLMADLLDRPKIWQLLKRLRLDPSEFMGWTRD